MSICVCAKCKKPWKAPSSPARCSHCGEVSFAIAIQIGSQVISTANEWPHNPEYRAAQSVVIGKPPTAETRAKLSASSKKHWQDPEYLAKQRAALKKRWQDPEYRAKQRVALKKRWQDPEYLAKQRAASIGRHPSAETKAKISAALTGRHVTAETKAKLIGRHLTAETRAKISAGVRRHSKKVVSYA